MPTITRPLPFFHFLVQAPEPPPTFTARPFPFVQLAQGAPMPRSTPMSASSPRDLTVNADTSADVSGSLTGKQILIGAGVLAVAGIAAHAAGVWPFSKGRRR